MDLNLIEWLGYIFRWLHLIAAIAWIGSSLYFMWLDAHIESPKVPRPNVEGELWMVHSGGFYQVEKRFIAAGEMPKTLHWFKWEAAFTWITGIVLLGLVYYTRNAIYLIDLNVANISATEAIVISLAVIAGSWFAYDLLWQSALARKQPGFALALSCAVLAGLIYFLCHLYSGRGAFVHVGALLGTIMVANVWVRILPAQQKMIDATTRGEKPDFSHGEAAKRRSVHNSYMTFPVIFTMLSNHYSNTYGHAWNWLVLIFLCILGGLVRHYMILLEKKKPGRRAYLIAAVLVFITLVIGTAPELSRASRHDIDHSEKVSFAEVKQIIGRRCIGCHSSAPNDSDFSDAPNGVKFDDDAMVQAFAQRIKARTVELKTMPLNNKTNMTDEERARLGAWVDAGALIDF